MVFLQPKHGGREQKAVDLRAVEIEQHRSPLRHFAAAGVCVFIERRAVEAAQAVRVARKVRGDPVHDDADAAFMRAVDEVHEILRRAVTRSRGKVSGDLIAPALVIRILGERHELDVRIAHVGNIIDEFMGKLAVRQPLPPCARVYFIDADGFVVEIAARFEIPPVRPRKARKLGDHGGSPVLFRAHRIRVGAVHGLALPRQNCIFVELALACKAEMRFPHAGRADRVHGIRHGVPLIEIADDAYRERFGRPDRKTVDRLARCARARMATERLIGCGRNALVKIIQFVIIQMKRHSGASRRGGNCKSGSRKQLRPPVLFSIIPHSFRLWYNQMQE